MIVSLIIFAAAAALLLPPVRRRLARPETESLYKKAVIILLAADVLAAGVFALDLRDRRISEVDRGGYGEGTLTTRVRLGTGDGSGDEPFDVEINRRARTKEEEARYISLCRRDLKKVMLAGNADADHVESDLNLPEKLKGNPTVIRWSQDDYSVIRTDGTIVSGAPAKTGSKVVVTAHLTCGSTQERLEIPVTVYPAGRRGRAALKDEAAALIRRADEADPSSRAVRLPQTIGGKTAVWKREPGREGYLFIVLGITGALFCVAAGREKERQKERERQRMIEEDYPKMLNLFSLLLRAGLTPGHIWALIVSDYEAGEDGAKERPIPGEMASGLRKMRSGRSQEEVYMEFGRNLRDMRCSKFGQLLASNLRHGSANLADQLASEARSAFEEQKLSTKARGEEAQTKLLLPMLMLLAVVLIAVMVPAFMSMQMG